MTERITDAEQAVMEVLWDAAPLTASDVAARVDPARGWSERTVKTLLSRLLGKGILAHEEEGRRYLYRPTIARADYVATESKRLVDRLFGGRAVPLVMHLAEREAFTPEDIAELEALVKAFRS